MNWNGLEIPSNPYYQDDATVIYQSDCQDVLPLIPEMSIDLILTDPPYGIDYQSNMRVATKQFDKILNDDIDITGQYSRFYSLLSANGIAAIFCSFKNYARDYIALEKYFDIKNCIVWFKGGGGIGDLSHSLATDYELIQVAHKGNGIIRGKRDGSVWWSKKVPPAKMVHPTEKPIDIIGRLITTFSDAGNVILDPFLGSGIIAFSAKKLGRKCIGIEIEERYAEIATKRCSQQVLDMALPQEIMTDIKIL